MLHAALLSLALAAQAPSPDNTKVNRPGEITASSQKNGVTDLTITRDIRRAIMADKSLSTYGHNVKVITANGFVTLKGPVRSEDERKAIEAKAIDVAGRDRVANELKVTPAKN